MDKSIIRKVEAGYQKAEVPEFRVGDTVDVHQKIVEGNRTRTQIFNGVVIARKGGGLNESFTVRRIVNNEGVEKSFLLHSPLVTAIDVKRRGKTRRAKLYFLRGRVGKARKLRELRRSSRTTKSSSRPVEPSAAERALSGVAEQPATV
ncbi:MAG: 50S ribosomal protein L19 [Phycisphaerales bacterium]|nr:50S ribosomal protein L19 [Phycisphaerales bacterium]